MSEFTADILIVIFVLYFISYLLILKELSYKNALKNENIELDTLVNNKHWIAVKHVKKDKFVCYDPDGGKDSDGSTIGKAIENLRKGYVISGLYICI